MRNFRRYILVMPLVLFAASGCLRVEEEDMAPAEELVTLSFEAVMEGDQTKTALTGGLGDAHRNLTWLPGDEIAIFSHNNNQYYKFTNINTEVSEVGNFTGEAVSRETYYAVYPYSAVNYMHWEANQVDVKIPERQVYAENTFATDMNPMVARTSKTEVLQFKNLCGLLAVNLTSTEGDIVKSVTLAAYDASGNVAQIAGNFGVDMNYETEPVLVTPYSSDYKAVAGMIEMDCGDGVQLSETPVPFHFVLAPGEYSKISIIVTTTDGKTMIREGKNPLTINRAEWIAAGSLSYAENVSFDLSSAGYANCYVVSKAGVYSFNASVIGNGEFGMVPNSGFHTDDPSISPVSAEILWEDRAGVVAGAVCSDGRISFVSTGIEGNALIAAKDADGNILWSWHIWSVNDQIDDQVYVNSTGTYTVQDRNLGAIRDDRGVDNEWLDAVGVLYQWGRKDPFTVVRNGTDIQKQLYTTNSSKVTIAEAVANPTVFEGSGNSSWETTGNSSMWIRSQKTIYDPCPSGYRVIDRNAWKGFTIDGNSHYDERDYYNVAADYDKGWNFIYDGTNSTYYPATSYIYRNGGLELNREYYGNMWSSSISSSSNAYRLSYYSDSNGYTGIELEGSDNRTYAYAVRCMKDVNAVTTVVSITGVTSITMSSASVAGNISVDGDREVTRRGFVYGTSADPVVDSDMVVEAGEGTGAFSAEITDLSAATKYYVRAFAVVDGNTVYSHASTFTTSNESGVIDLSAAGTANCYMISHAGTYKFKATVKGNGAAFVSNKSDASEKANEEKTTINPDTVKILWETLNTSDSVTEGSVIASVSLSGGYVTFTTPENFTPGNALIAVTTAGKVVWSWHIWAVDSDPETDAQIYQSGAMMMDRNLGALTVTPGDVRSYGLFYQWGRKDPFFGSGDLTSNTYAASYPVAEGSNNAIVYVSNDANYNNFAYAVANPSCFIQGAYWADYGRYWDSHKTMYDPCPVGWRVPDNDADVWSGFSVSRSYYGSYFDAPMSDPSAYYPYAGYLGYSGDMNYINGRAYLWKANDRGVFYTESSYVSNTTYSSYDGLSVRCMRDAEFSVTTTENIVNIADTYAVVTGNLVISDATVMDSKGFVFSDVTGDDLKLGKSDCSVADADNALAGDMSVTLSGLKPNTTYWYRAYARGAYNTRYGEVRSFKTMASGDFNEGFGSEDFDWNEE